jgi:hypothetical protein
MIYKLLDNSVSNIQQIRLIQTDGTIWDFPMSEESRYYQEYLKWLAEGNTPEPADEQN